MDASGLELRMLAHYMNDKEYTNEILNGDIHTANQIASGVNTRSQAKTLGTPTISRTLKNLIRTKITKRPTLRQGPTIYC